MTVEDPQNLVHSGFEIQFMSSTASSCVTQTEKA